MRQLRVVTLILLLTISSILLTQPIVVQGQPEADAPSNAYIRLWRHEDIIALDPWGDSDGDQRDLIAVYAKEGGEVYYFRVDLLDLRNETRLNIYLAIDYMPGGNTELVKGAKNFVSEIQWDLLIVLYDPVRQIVLDANYLDNPSHFNQSMYDYELDYVEFSIWKQALTGWTGEPFKVQAVVTDAGSVSAADRANPASTDAVTGRAKLVLSFGNLFTNRAPSFVDWYDGFALDPDRRQGERRGYKYLLDAIEKYQLPLVIFISLDTLVGIEYLGVTDRLRTLAEKELLELVWATPGVSMPWQPDDVDALIIRLTQQFSEWLGLPMSPVFYPAEGVVTAGDLEVIKQAGYPAMYAFDRYGHWFGWPDESDPDESTFFVEAQKKIHMVNGLKVFFWPGSWGFFTDERWEEIDWSNVTEYWVYEGTDGGLHLWWRRVLSDMAVDIDQEKFFQIGTDILLTPWVYRDVIEGNLKWLASHPWIEATTYGDILSRNWSVVDHGYLDLSPDQPLDRYPRMGEEHYMAYFWQFYYGGISDGHSPLIPEGAEIESYFDYVPYLRDGQLIPSGRKMGDDKTPGTIIYETLRNLRSAPENGLTTLAWLAYLETVKQQAWHAQTLYESGQPVSGDLGGQYLHPRARLRANYVRQVNKIVAAARWAEDAAIGRQSRETQVVRVDLDLDDEDEYVMRNNKVFAVFEDDGGRLEYAFAYDPAVGPVQLVAPPYQFYIAHLGPESWEWADGEVGEKFWWPVLADAAFVEHVKLPDERNYGYDIFDVELTDKSLTFFSVDGKITKTFTLPDGGNTIQAHYSTRPSDEVIVGFGLPVNPLNMWTRNWDDKLAKVTFPGGVGWMVEGGGYAVVRLMEARPPEFPEYEGGVMSFADSPAKEDMRQIPDKEYPAGHGFPYPYSVVAVQGAGEFSVGLTLSGRALKPPEFLVTDLVIAPTEAETGKNITVSLKVTNIGEQSGSYNVSPNINGITTEVKMVTLAGGESTTVIFTVTRNAAGTYNVDVDGLTGTFKISKPAETALEPYAIAIKVGIIIAILVIAAVAAAFILRKHAR